LAIVGYAGLTRALLAGADIAGPPPKLTLRLELKASAGCGALTHINVTACGDGASGTGRWEGWLREEAKNGLPSVVR
jgi:hypothetical protein